MKKRRKRIRVSVASRRGLTFVADTGSRRGERDIAPSCRAGKRREGGADAVFASLLPLARAARVHERSSACVLSHDDCTIVLISGKSTGDFGVSPMTSPAGTLRVASPARTLIDDVVRPGYSGGVKTVARAFELLRDRVRVKDLLAVVARLDHAYPYHQSVGFYMERAGFDRSALAPLRELGTSYDFYLAHAMKGTTRFDRTWRVRDPASPD